jgi:hypothetical protein
MLRTTTPSTTENVPIEVPQKSYQVYNILSQKNNSNDVGSTPESEGSILVAIYNNTNARRAKNVPTRNSEQSFEMGNAWMQPSTNENINSDSSLNRRATFADFSIGKGSNMKPINKSFQTIRQSSNQENMRIFHSPSFNTGQMSVLQSPSESTSDFGQGHSFSRSLSNFKDWSRSYLFGGKNHTKVSDMPLPS